MQFVVFFNNIEKIAMSLLCRQRMKLQNKMELRKSLSRKHAVKNVYYMSCDVQASEECFCHDLLFSLPSNNNQFQQISQWKEIYGFIHNLEFLLNTRIGNVVEQFKQFYEKCVTLNNNNFLKRSTDLSQFFIENLGFGTEK